jgi:hypothetical protein
VCCIAALCMMFGFASSHQHLRAAMLLHYEACLGLSLVYNSTLCQNDEAGKPLFELLCVQIEHMRSACTMDSAQGLHPQTAPSVSSSGMPHSVVSRLDWAIAWRNVTVDEHGDLMSGFL